MLAFYLRPIKKKIFTFHMYHHIKHIPWYAGGPISGFPRGSVGTLWTFHQHLQEIALRSSHCRTKVGHHHTHHHHQIQRHFHHRDHIHHIVIIMIWSGFAALWLIGRDCSRKWLKDSVNMEWWATMMMVMMMVMMILMMIMRMIMYKYNDNGNDDEFITVW